MAERFFQNLFERYLPFLWRQIPVASAFGLGILTAFHLRDELNFPTYLRVKQAYLTHQARLMIDPNPQILRVIDPVMQIQANALSGMQIRQS